jgi:hypothetical protein
VISLGQKVERHDKQIEEMRQELRDLTLLVHQVVMETRHRDEKQTLEREKLLLRLENQLLRFERRLPPPKSKDDGEDE